MPDLSTLNLSLMVPQVLDEMCWRSSFGMMSNMSQCRRLQALLDVASRHFTTTTMTTTLSEIHWHVWLHSRGKCTWHRQWSIIPGLLIVLRLGSYLPVTCPANPNTAYSAPILRLLASTALLQMFNYSNIELEHIWILDRIFEALQAKKNMT